MIVWLIVAVAVLVLAAIVFAPWRRIRAEKPLEPEVETRIMSGEDPKQIAADLDARSAPGAEVPEVDPPELRTREMTALRAIGDDTETVDDLEV